MISEPEATKLPSTNGSDAPAERPVAASGTRSVGGTTRRWLGPLFPIAGAAYRRVFVDLIAVAAAFPEMSPDSTLLDVGGGDGILLNHVLDHQPSLRIVSLDLASDIGGSLRPDLRPSVRLLPGMSVKDFTAQDDEPVDCALLAFMLHHVAPADREVLIHEVIDAFRGRPVQLIVIDVTRQGVRSRMGLWSDINISGDKGTSLISPVEVVALVRSVRPDLAVRETGLLRTDFPNYCLVFSEPTT